MSKPPQPPIQLSELLHLLEESGFEVELRPEEVLLAAAAQPGAKARSAHPKIKGLIVPDENRILINRDLPLNDRVQTAIHELLHLRFPELSEATIERETQRLFADISDRQLGHLEWLVS